LPHGKLAAMHARVTPEYERPSLSSAARRPERPAAESAVFAALRADVAAALDARAHQIGGRWAEQVRTVALREEGAGDSLAETAASLVASLAAALGSDGSTSDDLVGRGLSFGAEASSSAGRCTMRSRASTCCRRCSSTRSRRS
jgi:hypothetical protein